MNCPSARSMRASLPFSTVKREPLSLAAVYFTPNNIYIYYFLWALVPIAGLGLWPLGYLQAVTPWFDRKLGLALGCTGAFKATPVEITVNGEPRHVSTGSTVASLLQELALEPRGLAVERNLELVPRGAGMQPATTAAIRNTFLLIGI